MTGHALKEEQNCIDPDCEKETEQEAFLLRVHLPEGNTGSVEGSQKIVYRVRVRRFGETTGGNEEGSLVGRRVSWKLKV